MLLKAAYECAINIQSRIQNDTPALNLLRRDLNVVFLRLYKLCTRNTGKKLAKSYSEQEFPNKILE